MVVLFDTSILLLALQPSAKPPHDPETKKPLEYAKERVDYLIRKLDKARTKVLVPTPTLSELLVYAGTASNDYIKNLQQSPFKIVSFDIRAAIECAEAFRVNGTKGNGKDNPRSKVKFDRQIVSIARVEQAKTIYSDDAHIFQYAKQLGLSVVRSYELELDPEDRQGKLGLQLTT